MLAQLPQRDDKAGQGHFGAKRGGQKHNGIDYACLPGTLILAPCDGRINKIGYPYGDAKYGGHNSESEERTLTYVQIVDENGMRHRLFYVEPTASSRIVKKGDVIGVAMDVSLRYPSKTKPMTPHVHYEVMDSDDQHVDPAGF